MLAAPPSFDAVTAQALRVLLQSIQMPEAPNGIGDIVRTSLLRRLRRPILFERLARSDLDVRTALVITFSEQLPVPAAAIGSELQELLTSCGLLREVPDRPDHLVAPLTVSRIGETFVIADPIGAEDETVMPPGPGTVRLARLLPAKLDGLRVLDLCAGPGPVALVAAAGGADVVAIDLSERCAAFMRANALLNDAPFEIRLGDLFEPVRGEEFDVVSCHPPYVELPDALDSVLYLHGGPRGEELPYRVIAGVPAVLAPGGEAIVEFHASDVGEKVNERIEELLADTDCELALFTVPMDDPDARAVHTGVLHDPDLGDAFDPAVVSYRQHLERIGREGTAALVYLRRRRPEWARQPWKTHANCRDLPGAREGLDAHIATVDLVAANEMAHLLERQVRSPSGTVLVMEAILGSDDDASFNVKVPVGTVAAQWELTPVAARLLQQLCEAAVVRDVLELHATDTQRDLDAALINEVLEFVVHNLLKGVLVVVDAASPAALPPGEVGE